jgi:WD repeat and FYVE domain-containing protein 3
LLSLPTEQNEQLGKLILEALTTLLTSNNSTNANVFRESGGAKCIHEMVNHKHIREETLGIIRELILSPSGDDDMLFLLSQTMHSASSNNIELKIQILKALMGCLRDSHRTRTTFRKVSV